MYHHWTIRAAVKLALYTLPVRKSFLSQLGLDPDIPDIFLEFARNTNKVENILNQFYSDKDYKEFA